MHICAIHVPVPHGSIFFRIIIMFSNSHSESQYLVKIIRHKFHLRTGRSGLNATAPVLVAKR